MYFAFWGETLTISPGFLTNPVHPEAIFSLTFIGLCCHQCFNGIRAGIDQIAVGTHEADETFLVRVRE